MICKSVIDGQFPDAKRGKRCRSAATYFGINRKTVDKMLVSPEPPQHGRFGRSFSRKLIRTHFARFLQNRYRQFRIDLTA